MRIGNWIALLALCALAACGGGGGDDGGPHYVEWNGNANGSTVLDANNSRYAVDADSHIVVALASTTRLLGLVVDDRARVLDNGIAIGYVGAATSTTGSRIMVFFCSDGSAMTITLASGGWRTGCASAAGGGTGGGGTGGGGGGGSASFSVNETGEINATLTSASPNYVDSGGLTLTQTTRVWAFTWSESAARFVAVDAANAAIAKAGGTFSGYPMAPAGQYGMNYVTLPAGTWYVAVIPNGSVPAGYSNRVYAELSVPTLSGAVEVGNVPLSGGGQPGSWRATSFTVGSGSRAFLETEGSGGLWAVMTAAQYTSFSTAYAGGYNGGSFGTIYACGGTSGGAALEIECELQLPPGTYYLLYVNNSGGPAGGAANIGFFQ